MSKSEILTAIDELRTSMNADFQARNKLLQQFMTSIDTHLAQLESKIPRSDSLFPPYAQPILPPPIMSFHITPPFPSPSQLPPQPATLPPLPLPPSLLSPPKPFASAATSPPPHTYQSTPSPTNSVPPPPMLHPPPPPTLHPPLPPPTDIAINPPLLHPLPPPTPPPPTPPPPKEPPPDLPPPPATPPPTSSTSAVTPPSHSFSLTSLPINSLPLLPTPSPPIKHLSPPPPFISSSRLVSQDEDDGSLKIYNWATSQKAEHNFVIVLEVVTHHYAKQEMELEFLGTKVRLHGDPNPTTPSISFFQLQTRASSTPIDEIFEIYSWPNYLEEKSSSSYYMEPNPMGNGGPNRFYPAIGPGPNLFRSPNKLKPILQKYSQLSISVHKVRLCGEPPPETLLFSFLQLHTMASEASVDGIHEIDTWPTSIDEKLNSVFMLGLNMSGQIEVISATQIHQILVHGRDFLNTTFREADDH